MSDSTDKIYPHLSKAPIREAVLDFMIQPQLLIEERHLAELKTLLGARYDKSEPISMKTVGLSFSFQDGIGSAAVADETPVEGFIFRDDDAGYIAQIRRDRIVISKLSPYDSFVNFKSEAYDIFSKICILFPVDRVNRIGLRYINDVVMLEPREWYLRRDTLHAQVNVPLSSTHHRYDYKRPGVTQGAVLQVAVGTMNGADDPHLIVDIDAFSIQSIPVADHLVIDGILDQLDDFKNEIFFDVTSDDFQQECM